MNLLVSNDTVCCKLQGQLQGRSPCTCPAKFNIQQNFLIAVLRQLAGVLESVAKNDKLPERISCTGATFNSSIKSKFDKAFNEYVTNSDLVYNDKGVLRLRINSRVEVTNATITEVVAKYDTDEQLIVEEAKTIKHVKPFYRIGTTHVSTIII